MKTALTTQLKKRFSPSAMRQLVKFGIAGAATFGTDYITFVILTTMSVPLYIAAPVSNLVGFSVSFTLNRLWVFGATKETQHHETKLQIALYVALLGLNMLFTYYFIFFTGKAGLSAYIAKLITMILITGWNFVLYKKVIFAVK